jgi:hypothetical protein
MHNLHAQGWVIPWWALPIMCLVRIPREVGHPFHLKRATHSNGSGPPIPLEVSHPIQWKWATPVDELGYGPTQVEADAG